MPGQEKIVSVRMAPRQQHADLQADRGDHRDQGVAQRMNADDAERRQALGAARCAHSLRQHFEHGRARSGGQ